MNHEERLNTIKKNIEQATIQKAKWEQELEAAQSTLGKLFSELSDKFGVTTVEQAKELLFQLNGELTTLMAEAENQLESFRHDR